MRAFRPPASALGSRRMNDAYARAFEYRLSTMGIRELQPSITNRSEASDGVWFAAYADHFWKVARHSLAGPGSQLGPRPAGAKRETRKPSHFGSNCHPASRGNRKQLASSD